MSKKPQVSIRGATYDKVKAYCTEQGLAIAEFVDGLCAGYFARGGDQRKGKKKGNGNGTRDKTKVEPVIAKKRPSEEIELDHRKVKW